MLKLYSNIKQRRIELGMSQEDLAKKVGYSGRSMIAKIEAGKIDLSQSKIDEIAKALETSSAILMGHTDSVQSNYFANEYDEYTYNTLMKLSSIGGENVTIDTNTITKMWNSTNRNIGAVADYVSTIREKMTSSITTLENFCDEFKIGGKFDYNSIDYLSSDALQELSFYLDRVLEELSNTPYMDISYDAPTNKYDISDIEYGYIKKYRELCEHGKEVVDFILDKEYQNSKVKVINPTNTRMVNYYYKLASAGTGQIIFDTPPTKSIEIPNSYKNVDYAIGVNGDSMEPMFSDSDILLVQMTTDIEVGDIGIFQIDGQCYVKKLGHNELISINEEYDNIPLNESASCKGKVIDKLQKY